MLCADKSSSSSARHDKAQIHECPKYVEKKHGRHIHTRTLYFFARSVTSSSSSSYTLCFKNTMGGASSPSRLFAAALHSLTNLVGTATSAHSRRAFRVLSACQAAVKTQDRRTGLLVNTPWPCHVPQPSRCRSYVKQSAAAWVPVSSGAALGMLLLV